MNDKIIEVRSDEDRRLHARRASDRYRDGDGMARERRYHLLTAATHIVCGLYGNDEKVEDAVILAEEILVAIERRDLEKQQKGHEALTERNGESNE